MQTAIDPARLAEPRIARAEEILRSCVHCGFCLATCPTYQLLGDELDSPRGRIYQIKNVLEGGEVTASVQLHLDRCLSCRSCETTCPSGVQYAQLLDIGRVEVARRRDRGTVERLKRLGILSLLPYRARVLPLVRTAQQLRGVLPKGLKRKIPAAVSPGPIPPPRHERRLLRLQGCVQPALAPEIDAAATRLADWLGFSLVSVPGAGCCGALPQHMGEEHKAAVMAARNLEAWWPEIESGAEAILSTASGCGLMLKEYDSVLKDDSHWGARAARAAALVQDPLAIFASELVSRIQSLEPDLRRSWDAAVTAAGPVAFQTPCTLQHGLGMSGQAESMLGALGVRLCSVPDAHLCCGSAGTYSLFQPEISMALRDRKLAALSTDSPALILTANIGCLLHLAEASEVPVQHWIVAVDRWLSEAGLVSQSV